MSHTALLADGLFFLIHSDKVPKIEDILFNTFEALFKVSCIVPIWFPVRQSSVRDAVDAQNPIQFTLVES